MRCKGGAWTDDGKCDSGQTCQETKSSGEVVATQCLTPPTLRGDRAAVCAKAAHCTNVWFGDCMNPPPTSFVTGAVKAFGLIKPSKLLFLEVDAKFSCLQSATKCTAVQACFAGSVPKCASDLDDACLGSVARICSDGATMASDCAKVGLPCSLVGGGGKTEVLCTSGQKCTPSPTVTCSGAVATSCIPTDKSSSSGFALSIDCAYFGGTCTAGAKADDDFDDVCTFGGTPCTDGTPDVCKGSVLHECQKGKLQAFDCGKFGTTCEVVTVEGTTGARCTSTPGCSNADGGCKDGSITFCDGSSGLRAFSCAKTGMVCKANGFECEFATP